MADFRAFGSVRLQITKMDPMAMVSQKMKTVTISPAMVTQMAEPA